MELTEEELQEKITEATKGLTEKNTELIGDIKKAKKLMKAFDGVDLDLLTTQATELAELKDKNLTDAERLANEQSEIAERHTATKQKLADSQAENVRMKRDNSVNNALIGAGAIQDGMGRAVRLLINEKVTTSDEGVQMVGDKTVNEYVKHWSENDGKGFFVPKNSGGGATGSGSGGNDTAKYFDPKSPFFSVTKQAETARRDPAEYKQYKEQYASL